MTGPDRAAGSARGVALIIVLWTVAALSVLVLGLVHAQRSELRLADATRSLTLDAAIGRAAIQLLIQRQRSPAEDRRACSACRWATAGAKSWSRSCRWPG
ncbi:hypothetical protein MASR1M6_27030 [Rubrivivax sp.]